MIASLTGTVADLRPAGAGGAEAELDVHGVGYQVFVPSRVAADLAVGKTVRLSTHLVTREDSMTIYGFAGSDQREMFRHLLGVTGVGPKLALAVLSAFEPEALARAVASADIDALTSVPGIAKRGAERLILELKEKLAASPDAILVAGSKLAEVRDALAGLGYSPAEAREALERIGAASSDQPVEELVRAALKELARA